MKSAPERTADVSIACYWMETQKRWLFVARNSRGAVLSRLAAETSSPLDRAGATLVLRAMREELESHLA